MLGHADYATATRQLEEDSKDQDYILKDLLSDLYDVTRAAVVKSNIFLCFPPLARSKSGLLIPHSTTFYHILPHSTARYHILPHPTTSYHILPHSTTFYHILPHFTTFYHIPPHSTTSR